VYRRPQHAAAHHWGAVPVPPPASGSPQQLLADRFARGEIDEEEYRRRLAVLQNPEPPPG
jgi:putative membrane protein